MCSVVSGTWLTEGKQMGNSAAYNMKCHSDIDSQFDLWVEAELLLLIQTSDISMRDDHLLINY